MGNIDTTQVMKSTVEYARNRAKEAESDFDRANSAIQRKASRTIDLFGGSAASSVVDIAHDARVACDNLYATYQSLVVLVDEKCRPLLSQDPDVGAVREVKELIEWLNEESEIENNFTASLNGRDLGDVASRKYVPGIDSKIIERYWEDKYMTFPGREEAEAKERAERYEQMRIQQEIKEKKDAEERAEHEKAMLVYQEQYKEWDAVRKKQEALRKKELSDAISKEKAILNEKRDNAYRDKKHMLEKQKMNAQQDLHNAQEKLSGAGFFAFSVKKEAKLKIAESQQVVADTDEALRKLDKDYNENKSGTEKELDKKKKELKAKIDKKYPIPSGPRKPVRIEDVTSLNPEEQSLAKAIIFSMEPGKLYTIADIIRNCPEVADFTNQRVSYLVRRVMGTYIERVEDKRNVYFKLL